MGRRKTKRTVSDAELRKALEAISDAPPSAPSESAPSVDAQPATDDEDDEEPDFYVIRPWTEKAVSVNDDEEKFIDRYEGSIIYFVGESRRERAGRFRVFLVRVGDAEAAGELSVDLFDGHSDTLSECWEALFGPRTDDLKKAIREKCDVGRSDILILDKIEIVPAHRGRSLGLAVASKLIDLYGGGCGLVACKPYPLQLSDGRPRDKRFHERMRLKELPKNRAVGFRKLREYWGKLGFERFGRTDYFILATAHDRPKLEDICDVRGL